MFFFVDLLQRVLSSTCCNMFCRDLLQQVIVSSTVCLFVGFHMIVQMTKFDSTESSYQILILFVCMLQSEILGILGIFFIIKCVSLELIIFAINLVAASSSRVFNTLIVCFYRLYY